MDSFLEGIDSMFQFFMLLDKYNRNITKYIFRSFFFISIVH